MPSAFDTVDFGCGINEIEVNICDSSEIEAMPYSPCSNLIEDLQVRMHMEENNIAMPEDPESMHDLYVFLREDIKNNLWLHLI